MALLLALLLLQLVASLLSLLLVVSLAVLMVSTTVLASPPGGSVPPDFGPNVFVFDPGMPLSQIQAQVDFIKNQMVDNEMGDRGPPWPE